MAKPLLALCSIPKAATRDGNAGANAAIFLPFFDQSAGYWFADGLQYTFPKSTLVQDPSRTLSGTSKPDTFAKDCCSCIDG